MGTKILVADDSLTIQKVIAITLANSGHALTECTSEEDLYLKIKSSDYDLVLLDFNLSDSISGHELARKIHLEFPSVAIIVMLGTFDTVDESIFPNCGIDDKIVKPFESSKFIKKCNDVLLAKRTVGARENSTLTTGPSSLELVKDSLLNTNEWKVEAPKLKSADLKKTAQDESDDKVTHLEKLTRNHLDPLQSEIKGWGFEGSNELEIKFQKPFPPEIIEEAVKNSLESYLDTTDPGILMPENDSILDLKNSIEEDFSPDAFWAVDDLQPVQNDEVIDIKRTHLDEITEDLTEKIKQFQEAEESRPIVSTIQEKLSVESDLSNAKINEDELVNKLKLSLRPIIEELVREYCKENAEKVAWEIIPDLAENLIRKEIKEISDAIV